MTDSLIEEETKSKRTKQIDELMNSYEMQELLEEVASMLLRPNFPVVSLKKLQFQVREEIIQRKELFFADSEQKVDMEDVKEFVYSLVSQGKLQRDEYKKNRLDLYHKERIGLHFAIKRGCDGYLDQGDYNFYYNLFMPRQGSIESNRESSMSETSSFLAHQSSDDSYPQQLLDSQQPDRMFDFYTELQESIEALRQVEDKETPLAAKASIMFRHFLL